ncbi:MAG: Na/Pi symporter [Proteobacteria bacterium]|nr:Na/Pi symporter [Pseudomonadota bacterium]
MWVSDLLGSLGLFLLGMWLMTEGLKLAGGEALERLLGHWTSSRPKALFAGILITALVQSSSAITVAAIGFVNAGLMKFKQSVWVIFGSNVGTTLTAWLVTLFGFNVDIEAFTFPLFGLGAFLRVFAPNKRIQAFGMALAGFGLLFMGIDALQDTFSLFAERIDVANYAATGLRAAFIGLFIGFLLTMLTQSSSAAIAIILTAVASGIAELNMAAAAVIGANVGTTSTALIAALGATANARRLAFAHVFFNLITGVVALVFLPVFLFTMGLLIDLENNSNFTVFLALFHTSFNIMGILLMIPIEPNLTRWLKDHFSQEKKQKPITTLDSNVAQVPNLALRALTLELREIREILGRLSFTELLNHSNSESSNHTLEEISKRISGVNQFIGLISQSNLTRALSANLAASFSTSHYLGNSFESVQAIMTNQEKIAALDKYLQPLLNKWLDQVATYSRDITHTDTELQTENLAALQANYTEFKQKAITGAVNKQATMENVDFALLIGSLSRRFASQLMQANDQYRLLVAGEIVPGNETLVSGAELVNMTDVSEESDSRPTLSS